MKTRIGIGVSALVLGLMGAQAACSSDGGGGNGGSGPAGNGTCQNTCEKSVALACPGGPSDVPSCVQSCQSQQARCSDMPQVFQAFLDCIDGTPMECGSVTGQASSPQCVQQGLATLACLAGGGGSGGSGGSGGGGTGDFDVKPLATDLANPSSIEAHAGFVYVVDAKPGDGKILRIAQDGTVTPMAEGRTDPGPLAVDDSGLYWSEGSYPESFSIQHLSLDGGTPQPVVSGRRYIGDLSLFGDRVYFVESRSEDTGFRAAIMSAPKAGAAMPDQLVQHPTDVFHVLATMEGVYFSSQSSGIHRVALAGGDSVPFTTAGNFALAADDDYVYTADSFGVSVSRVPRTGGDPQPLVTDQTPGAPVNQHPFALAVDATHVWYLAGSGPGHQLLRVPKAGGQLENTTATPTFYLLPDMAIDGGAVFTLDQKPPASVLKVVAK